MKRIDSLVRSLLVGAGILLIAGFAVPSVSQAATISFDLTSDHCSGTNGCIATDGASAGTVSIADVGAPGSGVVTVTVSLLAGYQFVHTGFQTDFGFNLAGNPQITYSAVTGGFAPTTANPQSAGSLMMDGAGSFEYGITCTACGSGGSNPQTGPLLFTITGPTTLSTASFETNGINYFAVDLIGNLGNTGAVDASVPHTPVPEPSTVVLYGLGLTMLIVGQKWRKSRETSANLN